MATAEQAARAGATAEGATQGARAGDALWNVPVGGKYGLDVSFRFVARDTVPVNKLRYFHTVSREKPGYSGGTGGLIRIFLVKDGGGPDHHPTGNVLAVAKVRDPLNVPPQNLVRFDRTVILEKGEIYHVVFVNGDPAWPVNYVSVNTMGVMTPREKVEPPEDPVDMRVLMQVNGPAGGTGKGWMLFHPECTVTPIFTLYYEVSRQRADGVAVEGYGGMESWGAEPRCICGKEMVRQVFTPVRDVEVRRVSVRLGRTGQPGPLWVSVDALASGGGVGSRLGKLSIPAERVGEVNGKDWAPLRLGHTWVRGEFTAPLLLRGGVTYAVALSAEPGKGPPAGAWYEIFPLRDGAEFGYASPWPGAWAEYTRTGEKGWRGWDAWGKSNLKTGQLQLYLE